MATALVTCVGEVIVDFIATDPDTQLMHARTFVKAAGGAPANVAVGLSRLGTSSAFVGTVGDDPFGRFLVEFLRSEKVDVREVRFDPERRTRLAFISLTESGGRDFAFWEMNPADEVLRLTPADVRRISGSRIVHLSSFMLLKESARAAVMRLARQLRRMGTLISFDPNLRLSLWRSRGDALKAFTPLVGLADILRMNTEEASFLSGKKSPDAAASVLLRQGAGLVVITAGEKGCSFYSSRGSGAVEGFAVRPVDTTGCGDAFLAALLHGLAKIRVPLRNITPDTLRAICRYANGVGALAAMEYGAMTIPPLAVVENFLRDR